MTPTAVIELGRQAVEVTLLVSAPLPDSLRGPVQLRIRARGGSYDFGYAVRPGDWRTLRRGEDGDRKSTRLNSSH